MTSRVYRWALLALCLWCGRAAAAPADSSQVILFFGDSLSAGYGLEQRQAFPALIQDRLDSLGWNFQVVNAGLSGETSAAGRRRIGWLLKRRVEVLVLELGANDGLRGVSPAETERNLQEILTAVKTRYPQAALVLAGMQLPPNLGPEYTAQFQALFPRLAKRNQAALIPFLLEGVGGVPELNQADGIHPTAEGHRRVAATVWKTLEPVLRQRLPR
ncbi:MAG: arylesterase [Candidatus Latescibacteria bacterium]|nr:arylesterase [Candidatus Latescibacterota bacterium]